MIKIDKILTVWKISMEYFLINMWRMNPTCSFMSSLTTHGNVIEGNKLFSANTAISQILLKKIGDVPPPHQFCENVINLIWYLTKCMLPLFVSLWYLTCVLSLLSVKSLISYMCSAIVICQSLISYMCSAIVICHYMVLVSMYQFEQID